MPATAAFGSRGGEANETPAPRYGFEAVPPATMADIGQVAFRTAHDLGNHLVGIVLSLRQLRRRQRSIELEQILEQALETAEQGIAATQMLQRAAAASTIPDRITGGRKNRTV